jgi:hypothetical protein
MSEPRPDIADRGAGRDLEEAVNEAIEACDGDLLATVRALIVANGFLEEELNRTRAMLSRGYVRGTAKTDPGEARLEPQARGETCTASIARAGPSNIARKPSPR